MESKEKYKITIVYGEEAARYADENGGTAAAVKAINEGRLYGEYHTYEMSTREDAEQLVAALSNFNGWEEYWFEFD